jgi:ATP-dependent RNA helicase RhlE
VSFSALGLLPSFDERLTALGIRSPTPVQRVAVPALLGGTSAIAVARTGSGKTLAYGLPLLQRLRDVEDAEGAVTARGRPRAVVLTGTRELVEQTLRALKTVAHAVRLRVRAVSGGMPDKDVVRALGEPCDVLVANPPRLAALARAGRVDLSDVRVFVVDEADTLLMPGQRSDVDHLLGLLPRAAQIAWFSATLPEPIRATLLARPERPTLLLARDAHAPPERVRVTNLRIRADERGDAIHDALVAAPAAERGIVFCNRRETADTLGALLTERGHTVVVIHGARPPEERKRSMAAFRAGTGRVLVTTELGGRGLHIEGLAFVINYELPERPSEYLHRIGRVGRQGNTGRVVNLVTPADAGILKEVERLAQGGRLDTGEGLRAPRRREEQAAAAARRRKSGPAARPARKRDPGEPV